MQRAACIAFALVLLALIPARMAASQEISTQEAGFYRDIFDQNVYYEGTGLLRLDRVYRTLFHKKSRSLDVNIYDEVPDNDFFVNRQGRKALSADELKQGYREAGIDLGSPLTIVRGEVNGLHPRFFVRDAAGNDFVLKFDSFDYFELATASEVIASRFFHAIGYNVPQYDIVTIPADQLKVGSGAMVVDDTGFEKALTSEKLEEFLLFVPRDPDGNFRASVEKVLPGENKGYFNLTGRRKSDPNDKINHEDRRDVRALQVFASWLGNTDLREANTADMLVDRDGRKVLKHYLTNFDSALGSSTHGAKAPTDGHEYLFDYGESLKNFFTLGFLEKSWQKRWRENGEKTASSPALGYFDNTYFDPAKFKTELPHYAFKNLSSADAFWAAKIIKSFSDADIRSIVDTGKLSSADDAAYVAKTLSDRRDIIARYWFERTNPLDEFAYDGNNLSFKDLSVQAGFESAETTNYVFDIISKNGNKGSRIETVQNRNSSLRINPQWFSQGNSLDILIKTIRGGKELPYVLVELTRDRIVEIVHQD